MPVTAPPAGRLLDTLGEEVRGQPCGPLGWGPKTQFSSASSFSLAPPVAPCPAKFHCLTEVSVPGPQAHGPVLLSHDSSVPSLFG